MKTSQYLFCSHYNQENGKNFAEYSLVYDNRYPRAKNAAQKRKNDHLFKYRKLNQFILTMNDYGYNRTGDKINKVHALCICL